MNQDGDSGLREQLKLLEDLQQVDLGLRETEDALEALPKKLQGLKDDVAGVEAMLGEERARLAEAEAYKANIEREIRTEQDLLNKTKIKLAQVRNSKEYLAVQREFESSRRSTTEREDEVQKLAAAIEQYKQSISTHEQELSTLKEHVAAEEAETNRKVDELTAAATEQRLRREKMAANVRGGMLRKYNTISKRRGGSAVVPAMSGGVCAGCRMKLPPQLYNIIQRCNSIEQCPNCQRIVYYPGDETE